MQVDRGIPLAVAALPASPVMTGHSTTAVVPWTHSAWSNPPRSRVLMCMAVTAVWHSRVAMMVVVATTRRGMAWMMNTARHPAELVLTRQAAR